MKILVTGGAGFIGTNVCLYLKKLNHKPTALDNFSKPGSKGNSKFLTKSGVKVKKLDVKDISNKDVFGFDAIIHLAAIGSTEYSIAHPYEDFLNSTLGTLKILEIARKKHIPVIYSSTCKVYSSELNIYPTIEEQDRYSWSFSKKHLRSLRPAVVCGVSKYGVNENFPVDSAGYFPHAPYGVSHAAADFYCQEYFHMYGVPTVINRMSTVYGPHQYGNKNQGWVDWVVKSKIQGKDLELVTNGKTVRDILWVEDLAYLFLLELTSINKAKGGVYNIGGGPKNTLSIRMALKYLNKFEKVQKVKLIQIKKRPADQKIYISDIRKVYADLGWKPKVTASEGMEKLYQIYTNTPHRA